MLSLLIVPMLICGVIWIKANPSQRYKISAFQGWIIYLYAASYGAAAVFFSWVFLEAVIPWLFVLGESPVSVVESYFGIPFSLDDEYLKNIAAYVVEDGYAKAQSGDIYSAYMATRISFLAVGSILLTKGFCWLYKLYLFTMNRYEKKLLDVYKQNSPTDYYLLLLSARLLKITRSRENYELSKQSRIEVNSDFKKFVRRCTKLFEKYVGEDYLSDDSKDVTLQMYKDYLRQQKKRGLKLKRESEKEPLLAQVTLESRKVYIGAPQSVGGPDEHSIGNEELVIFPWFSGYRDEKTLGIKLTNEYSPLQEKEDYEVENVVVQKSKVSSVSAFSIDLYNKVQDNIGGRGKGGVSKVKSEEVTLSRFKHGKYSKASRA